MDLYVASRVAAAAPCPQCDACFATPPLPHTNMYSLRCMRADAAELVKWL